MAEMKDLKLTEVELAGIYGRFQRLKERSKVPIGLKTLGDMVAKAQLAKVQEGEQGIRALLWATHPCSGKYADDGELQCGVYLPPIDFKRDNWEVMAQGIERHTEQRVKELLKHRSKPELREEIKTVLLDVALHFEKGDEERMYGGIQQIEALYPDEEEIRKDAKREGVKWVGSTFAKGLTLDQIMATGTWQEALKKGE